MSFHPSHPTWHPMQSPHPVSPGRVSRCRRPCDHGNQPLPRTTAEDPASSPSNRRISSSAKAIEIHTLSGTLLFGDQDSLSIGQESERDRRGIALIGGRAGRKTRSKGKKEVYKKNRCEPTLAALGGKDDPTLRRDGPSVGLNQRIHRHPCSCRRFQRRRLQLIKIHKKYSYSLGNGRGGGDGNSARGARDRRPTIVGVGSSSRSRSSSSLPPHDDDLVPLLQLHQWSFSRSSRRSRRLDSFGRRLSDTCTGAGAASDQVWVCFGLLSSGISPMCGDTLLGVSVGPKKKTNSPVGSCWSHSEEDAHVTTSLIDSQGRGKTTEQRPSAYHAQRLYTNNVPTAFRQPLTPPRTPCLGLSTISAAEILDKSVPRSSTSLFRTLGSLFPICFYLSLGLLLFALARAHFLAWGSTMHPTTRCHAWARSRRSTSGSSRLEL